MNDEGRQADRRYFETELEKAAQQHALQLAGRDAVIADKDVVIVDLQAAVRSGELDPAVERWLADEEVRNALQRRDSAYRTRDYAFAAIWRVTRIHRPDEHHDSRCICGRSVRRCAELDAIESELDALKDWEDVQLSRLYDGLEHGLPADHPEVLRVGGPGRIRRRMA